MHISAVHYAPDYPYGQTPGTGSGYLVNNGAGYAIGATTIAADVGSGTILVGDRVRFAGHTTVYKVSAALSAGSFTIEAGLTAAIVDNAAITVGPTWTKFTDFLEEDLEPGMESIISVRMGEGGNEHDAVEFAGSILATGSNLPSAELRNWFRFTGEDAAGTTFKIVGGGDKGCRTSVGKASMRPAGGGPLYNRIEYTGTGGAGGSTVETDRTA